jgi:hypothetical protein
MPPASNGNPPYKGRSEELTTNIADFCNKIGQIQIELRREIPNIGDAEPRPTFGKVYQLASF